MAGETEMLPLAQTGTEKYLELHDLSYKNKNKFLILNFIPNWNLDACLCCLIIYYYTSLEW